MNSYLRRKISLFALPLVLGFAASARADWQKDDKSLAWKAGDAVVWQFNFDPAAGGKPFFHPLSAVGGANVTARGPVDHPWHYGLWFSWKYINTKNYWEEDRVSGKPAGKTVWSAPVITTQADGSANIKMALTYVNEDIPRVDVVESREIAVSAPDASGTFTIDWKARFIAGPDGALLDRTAMPGEPRGANNGGYGGMAIRMDAAVPTYISTEAQVTKFTANGTPEAGPGERARPNVFAMGFNFTNEGKTGSIAFLSDAKNTGGKPATWYLINGPTQKPVPFFFANQTVLGPKPIQMAPGEKMDLRYRFVLSRTAVTPDSLKAALAAWPAEKPAAAPAPAAAH